MKVYRSDISGDIVPGEAFGKTAVALGQFDSMHTGHLRIIKRVTNYAENNRIKSLVFMLSNDPAEVVEHKINGAVNTLEKRLDILERLGVNIVYVKKFDNKFMNTPPVEFIEKYLVDMFDAQFAAVGYNYRFGLGGEGDADLLTRECNMRGIDTCIIDEVRIDGEHVSTTSIRKKIERGDVSGAARLMGRYYSICGRVEHGNNIGGRLLGFPTANIPMPQGCVVPKLGVYISVARLDGKAYAAITNVGSRPTVGEKKVCIETHIYGDFANLYGKQIEVEFCDFIREIIKFDSLNDLKNRLTADKELSKAYFEKHKPDEREDKEYEKK